MSPAAEAQRSSKSNKLGGKEFEETFKPKGKEHIAEKDLEDKKGKKGKKEKKKKSGLRRILVIVMILVVIVAGAGAALYFSGNLNTVFEYVGLAKPAEAVTLEMQKAALDQREAALNEKEKSLEERQSQLDAQQKAMDDAVAAAEASASAAANRTFEEILADLSEEKLAELKQVGSIYSKMDAAAAAAIVGKIPDEKQIAVIIYNMQPAAAALVMANLDAELAASVTRIITS